mmetsp:Transcript_41901/g.107989  ORF Transcript_41901/g.107989 Transcript_41901/m.107989 type:complete len:204 (+) Transcript_41901:82-693(+)
MPLSGNPLSADACGKSETAAVIGASFSPQPRTISGISTSSTFALPPAPSPCALPNRRNRNCLASAGVTIPSLRPLSSISSICSPWIEALTLANCPPTCPDTGVKRCSGISQRGLATALPASGASPLADERAAPEPSSKSRRVAASAIEVERILIPAPVRGCGNNGKHLIGLARSANWCNPSTNTSTACSPVLNATCSKMASML